MKNIIALFIITILSSTHSFATPIDTSVSQSINAASDTGKLTAMKIYQDTKAGIEGLAKTLKVPAAHVYAILIKQQIISAISWLCLYVFLLVILLSLILIFINGLKKINNKTHAWHNDGIDEHMQTVVSLVFSILIFAALVISIIVTISDVFTGLFNPEYGAIKEIVSFIK